MFNLSAIKHRVVTFLTVPRKHEDPYVNAIFNTKVSRREALATLYLLIVEPLLCLIEWFGSHLMSEPYYWQGHYRRRH